MLIILLIPRPAFSYTRLFTQITPSPPEPFKEDVKDHNNDKDADNSPSPLELAQEAHDFAGPAQGTDLIVKKPVRISGQHIPTILSSQKTLKSKHHLLQSPGTIIDSTYWDWQRNGGMDDHIVIFDNGGTIQIIATMMAAYLEDTSDRMMLYYNWSGFSWSGHGDTVFPVRNGFGSMSQFPEGNPVFCTQGNVDGWGMRAYGAVEAFIGLRVYSFFGTSTDTVQLWPRITVNSDGSWIITGSGSTVYGIENSAS